MKENYLITGGAGFIGTNLAAYYLSKNKNVTILDNLSRSGTQKNVDWLQKQHGSRLKFVKYDIRNTDGILLELVENADVVFHQAAQVAVTTSVTNPREDFEVNATGTFNVLDAVRLSSSRPIVVFSSTNKVYGKMEDVEIVERDGRYEYASLNAGVPETRTLDFHSPYGCSKGCADQYMIDYSRIYGLETVVFRQSCIYGPHQFGVEDQGWVAWFSIRAMQNLPISIYGDGKQVRDVLYIEDLIRAYEAAIDNIAITKGHAYNIGGGPNNTLSLLELITILEEHFGIKLDCQFEDWRPGDQLIYVSDIQKAGEVFEWKPLIRPLEGVKKLLKWLIQNRDLFSASK
ncbi:MAG: NAD-dependent epimerase/dehydratase family protein [Planctomycetes bacterium]|nr:NAD-dependent epimerase/dehydratase family protein [Planctomycetota bacterium]